MPKRTLNDRAMKALKPALPGKLYDVTDTVVPGFGVRVSDSGRRTFILIARYPGSRNPTRRALGEYGELTLEKARTKARDWLELIGKGIDPREDQERQRLAQYRKRANLFAAVAEDFIKDKLPGERKGKEVERDIRREFMSAWSGRPITEITPHDVRAVVKAAKDRGAPYQAHNLLGHARRLFSWAIDQQVYGLESSPCDRLKPAAIIGKKKRRTRMLTDDEMRAFWRITARLRYPYGPLLRMLLLTGQRHREVAKATWSEFHPEFVSLLRRRDKSDTPIAWQAVKSEWKLWSVGEERFKSDAPHMVPLSDDVRAR
jgi:integrase